MYCVVLLNTVEIVPRLICPAGDMNLQPHVCKTATLCTEPTCDTVGNKVGQDQIFIFRHLIA